jgi:endonuclease/exonuclease/phosphatase family metal-dependent hydrolase
MPTKVTIATFNCENLFVRYNFNSNLSEEKKQATISNGFIVDNKIVSKILPIEKELTAKAIKATKADIIALQEVENLDTLKSFQSQFLKSYPYKYLIDGNDPRLIDVGVLSKMEALNLITHQYDKKGKQEIFSRDCLEVEYNIGGTVLTLFVNHFKSMLDRTDQANGRKNTMPKRKIQSERIVQIIKDKFGNNPANENFIVLGDFNDYMPSAGLNPLLNQPWLENMGDRLPLEEQWTHFWDGAPKNEDPYKQIDYILLSKRLAKQNADTKPTIIRNGLCLKANKYTGKRFDGIGPSSPAASDHCPVTITINV